MPDTRSNSGFIPAHGGYRNLITYQKAEIVYDGTVFFCNKFFKEFDRTVDQMVQAARSGKQNIAEASMASATSKETEIKLTNVARASLEELMIDYEDFLRINRLKKWDRSDKLSLRFSELNKTPDANYDTFKKGIEHENPEISANIVICLINVTSYLLKRQLLSLENEFLKEGGMRERMMNARIDYRNKNG